MRGRYQGQCAGDEHRGASKAGAVDGMADRIADNAIAEGQEVEHLHELFKSGDWAALSRFTDALKAQGWALVRIQSMLTTATAGVRIPNRGK